MVVCLFFRLGKRAGCRRRCHWDEAGRALAGRGGEGASRRVVWCLRLWEGGEGGRLCDAPVTPPLRMQC